MANKERIDSTTAIKEAPKIETTGRTRRTRKLRFRRESTKRREVVTKEITLTLSDTRRMTLTCQLARRTQL
jgi:hypothetical protein